MGLSKTEDFTKTQNEVATIAKALGHPARIAILQYLAEKKSCVCGDIVDELPLSQSTVSQHLKELKKVGLIKGEIEGPSVCYCIDSKALLKAKKLLGDLLQGVQASCC
jgi:DNA-binding transcriptional ArsR family regulator